MRMALMGVCAALFIALAEDAHAQKFVARTDRTEMASNETLTLEVLYADRADTDVIDFESLLPDFTILSNRPSSQTRIVNFKRSSQTTWQLTMLPKRVGRLAIPAFKIGEASTRPIEIVVSAAAESPEEGAPFSVRLVADRESAFVGEQILVRILLSAARGVADLRGSPLEIPGAEATLLNQSEFQRVIGGETYQVTELAYAVFPQSPGRLSIPPLQYTGMSRRRDFLVARTEGLDIEILDPANDKEASQKRPWLPADGLALASEWSAPIDSLEVGQPITRTIRSAAASQHAAAIPPFRFPDGAYKQYSEQPTLEDTETSTGILGRRTDSVVLVPTRPGKLHLPPIEIDWWNIKERRWEVARIPGETLQVAAATTAPRDVSGVAETFQSNGTTPTTAQSAEGSMGGATDNRLTLALGGLCSLLLTCCIALLIRVRRLESEKRDREPDQADFEGAANEKAAFNRTMRSLSSRDARDIRRDIIAWAGIRWPADRITRLEQVADRFSDPDLASILSDLDASLYRTDEKPSRVDFDRLRTLLGDARAAADASPPEKSQDLVALYPTDA